MTRYQVDFSTNISTGSIPVADIKSAYNLIPILKSDPAIHYIGIVGIYHNVSEAESKAGGRAIDPNKPHQRYMDFEDLKDEWEPRVPRIFIPSGNEIVIRSWRKNYGHWQELDPDTGYPYDDSYGEQLKQWRKRQKEMGYG